MTPEERLARSPNGELYFGPNEIDVAAFARLAALPEMAKVRVLRMPAAENLGDAAISALARSPCHFETLELAGWGMTDAGLAELVASSPFATVKRLCLGSSGMRQKTEGPKNTPFRAMWVNFIGDAGFAALAASTNKLVELDLSHTTPTQTGVLAIVHAPWLAHLRMLRFESCFAMQATGVRAIVARTDLGALEELHLSHSNVKDEGAVHLAGASTLAGLRTLTLGVNGIHADGARALANSTSLAELVDLNLTGNELGPDGAVAFSTRIGLPKLRRLGLLDNGLSSKEYEEWTDWNGTAVGGGYRKLNTSEITASWFAGQDITIY